MTNRKRKMPSRLHAMNDFILDLLTKKAAVIPFCLTPLSRVFGCWVVQLLYSYAKQFIGPSGYNRARKEVGVETFCINQCGDNRPEP